MQVSQCAEKRLSDAGGQDTSWPSAEAKPFFLGLLCGLCQERSRQTEQGKLGNVPKGVKGSGHERLWLGRVSDHGVGGTALGEA